MYSPRVSALLPALALLVLSQGCAGGAGVTPPASLQPGGTGRAVAIASGAVQVESVTGALQTKKIAGPIVALGSNGAFQIQGPIGVGYTWIYPVSTTAEFYDGLKPALNEYAVITATGATYAPVLIGLYKSAPGSASFTGTVTSLQPYGVAVQDKATGVYVPVALSTSSVVSVGLTVGTTISVSGPGSSANGVAVFANSVTNAGAVASTPTPAPSAAPTAAPTTQPTSAPAATAFMPSSLGKISAFQIFDETGNGTITGAAAAADGFRYSAVWGVRPGLGSTWRDSNANLRSSYYMLMDTDQSTTAWGAIGHSLSWWQANHPTWVMYACTSAGVPTTTPAYDSGLPNVPLDIHNPNVVNYQIAQQAVPYALKMGYTALAVDEVTFWFPGSGGPGYYPCGTWNNGTFTREYSGPNDQTWAANVVAWVKAAHTIIKQNNLKLIVSHPGENITANEQGLLANVDADMDETGFTNYGNYLEPSVAPVTREATWMKYAQEQGTAVLINQDWGSIAVGPAQKDYSIATYLLGNEQAASLFVSTHTGYGLENWYPEYGTNVGAPCGEYYGGAGYSSTSPAMYYRKFANAYVVVNAGGSGTEVTALPAGHVYTDLEGRAVTSPLSVGANDGYVLKTTNGCSAGGKTARGFKWAERFGTCSAW